MLLVLSVRFLGLFELGGEWLVRILFDLLICAQNLTVGKQDDSLVFHKLNLELVAVITLQFFGNLNA